MTILDRNPLSTFLRQLESLDDVVSAFLVVDETFKPIFLSQSGAKLLNIRHRTDLQHYVDNLRPLSDFAKIESAKARKRLKSLKESASNTNGSGLTLRSTDNRIIGCIAHYASFDTSSLLALDSAETGHSELGAHIVRFFSTSYLEPLIWTVELARKHRNDIVRIKCQDLLDLKNSDSRTAGSIKKPGFDDTTTTDILPAVTDALSIVDTLIIPSVTISLDIPTSFLLKIDQKSFVEVISLTLLEGAEFVGWVGKLKVSASAPASRGIDKKTGSRSVNITVSAERDDRRENLTHPIENYLLHRCLPMSYGAILTDQGEQSRSVKNSQHAPKHRLAYDSSENLKEIDPVSPDGISQGLRIVEKALFNVGGKIKTRRPRSNLLVIALEIELAYQKELLK